MPEILEYERGQTAIARAQRARVAFSAACVPSVVLSAAVAAVLWHVTGGGGEFGRTLSVSVRYCGLAGLVGLLVIWTAALLPYGVGRARSVTASAAAGAAYGIAPSVAFGIAEGMERYGDWVWLVALFATSVCVPVCVTIWLTLRR